MDAHETKSDRRGRLKTIHYSGNYYYPEKTTAAIAPRDYWVIVALLKISISDNNNTYHVEPRYPHVYDSRGCVGSWGIWRGASASTQLSEQRYFFSTRKVSRTDVGLIIDSFVRDIHWIDVL